MFLRRKIFLAIVIFYLTFLRILVDFCLVCFFFYKIFSDVTRFKFTTYFANILLPIKLVVVKRRIEYLARVNSTDTQDKKRLPAFLWPRSRISRSRVSTSRSTIYLAWVPPRYGLFQGVVSAFMEPAYSVGFRFTASCQAISRRLENMRSSRWLNEFAMLPTNTS